VTVATSECDDDSKITDVDTLCCDERWLSMLDLRGWILHEHSSYPVSHIRIVNFQGKTLWNVEVRAKCTQEFGRSNIGCCGIFRRRHWFLLGRNFERCIRILCTTILVGADTVKVRSDPTKIKVGHWYGITKGLQMLNRIRSWSKLKRYQ
jgi:hypothetical protein